MSAIVALTFEELVTLLKSLSEQELRELRGWHLTSVQFDSRSMNLVGRVTSDHELNCRNAYKCIMAHIQHEKLREFIALYNS